MLKLSQVLWIGLIFLNSSLATAHKRVEALRLFDRLAGTPLALKDLRLTKIEALLDHGQVLDAAHIATDDDGFYNITLRHWASSLSNREENPSTPLNDFTALVIGLVRDKLDFREALSGDFIYFAPEVPQVPFYEEANNLHFEGLDVKRTNLRQNLVKRTPQHLQIKDAAGLLTTRAWGLAHLKDGTNRRAIAFAFREFLCTPIEKLSDTTVKHDRIRRDVDRAPGGNPKTFKALCAGCHGGMDALAGAYSRFDFVDGQFLYFNDEVAPKTKKNAHVFPTGFVNFNDYWINEWTANQNVSLGWGDGPKTGYGIHELGTMLSNTAAFGRCMTQKVYQHLCKKDLELTDPVVLNLSQQFQSNGYDMRKLFEDVAVEPSCMGIQ